MRWRSRHIYDNRYVDAPVSVYRDLLAPVREENYYGL